MLVLPTASSPTTTHFTPYDDDEDEDEDEEGAEDEASDASRLRRVLPLWIEAAETVELILLNLPDEDDDVAEEGAAADGVGAGTGNGGGGGDDAEDDPAPFPAGSLVVPPANGDVVVAVDVDVDVAKERLASSPPPLPALGAVAIQVVVVVLPMVVLTSRHCPGCCRRSHDGDVFWRRRFLASFCQCCCLALRGCGPHWSPVVIFFFFLVFFFFSSCPHELPFHAEMTDDSSSEAGISDLLPMRIINVVSAQAFFLPDTNEVEGET